MAKSYYLKFGSGDPRNFSGLSPTLLVFKLSDGTDVTPPSITEVSTTGIYTFSWGTTTSICFLADGATTNLGSGRYVAGSLDPADRIDEVGSTLFAIGTSNIALGMTNVALGTSSVALGATNIALGTSNIALGTTAVALGTSILALGNTLLSINSGFTALIGSTASSYGTDSQDPVDLFGYLKRVQELLEGNQNYTKSTGLWSIYTRGSSQLLINKTITNSVSLVTKT